MHPLRRPISAPSQPSTCARGCLFRTRSDGPILGHLVGHTLVQRLTRSKLAAAFWALVWLPWGAFSLSLVQKKLLKKYSFSRMCSGSPSQTFLQASSTPEHRWCTSSRKSKDGQHASAP